MGRIDLIGKGWGFPFKFSNATTVAGEGVEKLDGIDKVRKGLFLILDTPIGSRQNRPDFGSRLRDLVFRPNDLLLEVDLIKETVEALSRWELRAIVEKVNIIDNSVLRKKGRLEIDVLFTLTRTHETGNFVYPLYLDPEKRDQAAVAAV